MLTLSLFNPLKIIPNSFFERDPREVAPDLLGKVLRHRIDGCWLEARIIETEAYLL
ncbi:MAG: DNA-3-methyladenine glycosylase, partial [bacterium]